MMVALVPTKWIRSSILIVLLLLNLTCLILISTFLTYDELVMYLPDGVIKVCSTRHYGLLLFFTGMANISAGVLSFMYGLSKSRSSKR